MSHHRHREESHANVPYAFTTDDILRLEEIKRKLSPGGRKVVNLILEFFNEDGRLNLFKLLELGQLMMGKYGLASENPSSPNPFEQMKDFALTDLLQHLAKNFPAQPGTRDGQ